MKKVDIGKECALLKDKCREGLCAWYMKDESSCSILVIAQRIKRK